MFKSKTIKISNIITTLSMHTKQSNEFQYQNIDRDLLHMSRPLVYQVDYFYNKHH